MNQEVLVSTIGPDGKKMTPEQARDYARKTNQNLGVFNSPEAAAKYADTLK